MTPDRRAWSAGRALLSTIVAVTVLLLAACSSDDGPPPPCPIVVLVKDADRLTRFEGSGRDLTDVVFETTIRNADVACAYDDNEVEAALRVLFATTRGPADTARRADFRYFVAVADREQNILAREEFDLAATSRVTGPRSCRSTRSTRPFRSARARAGPTTSFTSAWSCRATRWITTAVPRAEVRPAPEPILRLLLARFGPDPPGTH